MKELTINGRRIDDETLKKSKKLACSSAAGGLRLVAIGLVPELTLEAARRSALGAGAKVVGSFSYELNEDDLREIEQAKCDIVLLCGGTDGGNKETILHNAEMLANTKLNIPFVVAGNKVVIDRVKKIFE